MVNNKSQHDIYIKEPIYIDDEDRWIKANTKITKVVVIAEGEGIRESTRLVESYSSPKGSLSSSRDWKKMRRAAVLTDGKNDYIAEVHWYQAKYIGKVEWKVKRYY